MFRWETSQLLQSTAEPSEWGWGLHKPSSRSFIVRRIDDQTRCRVTRMLGDDPSIGQYLHASGGSAQLNSAAQIRERNRVLSPFECNQRVLGNAPSRDDIERCRKSGEASQKGPLGLPRLEYRGARGGAAPLL